MSLRVADRVDDWEERPFEGGYAGLESLADAEFSGVVRAGGAELYMTSGAVVGVEHGDVEDFESATGTAYESPVPALPLLCVMQAADADVRAQYYTEETPISEVDGTLSDGGFTGFVELSENVLSGDYFLVYHGGRSMAVGFVGAAQQLISGDEAFETADDEVGIYKVRQVDVEPIEIPEPPEPAASGASAEDPADESAEESTDLAEETADESADSADTEGAVADAADDETETTEPGDEPAAADGDSTSTAEAADRGEPTASARRDATEGQGAHDTGTDQRSRDDRSGSSDGAGRGRRRDRSGQSSTGGAGDGSPTPSGASQEQEAGAVDLETRSIPSLDPDRTHLPREERSTPAEPEPTRDTASQSSGGQQPRPSPSADRQDSPEPESTETAESSDLTELEAELADREAEIERLEAELADAEAAREDLEADLAAVREERDELADRVDELESELARLEEEMGAATDVERRLTPSEAVQGTNLFVDYDSKGAATLAKAHEGAESRADVAENLQFGVHTEFADAGVAVNGQAFGEWLRSTLHYRFAEWVVSTLLFEIRDTGHADDLVDLYDAIPAIRRVEFNGSVDVEYVEDGQEKAGREHFDVIFRHRMGDPLVVANLNDARDPATGSMMETLVTAAERVGQTADSLSTAVLVTSSFFESAALETVSEATRGGILSRDKRTSFVNLSRKRGYHLCLVAAREGNFHMEVPEL